MWQKITIWACIYDELMPFPWILARIQPGPPAPFHTSMEEKRRDAVAGCDPQWNSRTRTRWHAGVDSLGPPLLSSPFSSSSLRLTCRRRELGRRHRSAPPPPHEGLSPGNKGLPEVSSFHKVRSGQGLPFFLASPPLLFCFPICYFFFFFFVF